MSNTIAPPIIAFVVLSDEKLKSSGRCKKSAPIKTPIVPVIYAKGAAFIKSLHDKITEQMLEEKAGKSQYGKVATIPFSATGFEIKKVIIVTINIPSKTFFKDIFFFIVKYTLNKIGITAPPMFIPTFQFPEENR